MNEEKDNSRHLSYKFRLFPTQKQAEYFSINFKCTRFVYNHFLDVRIKAYEATKETLHDGSPNPSYDPNAKPLSFYDTSRELTKLKKEVVDESGRQWLYDADATALLYALRHLDNAYQNFYKRVKKGGNPGFPKFKSRDASRQSFTVDTCKVDREGYCISFRKIGAVDADVHREVRGEIIKATISRSATGKYYVSIATKETDVTPLPKRENAIGITMGISEWVVTSEGQIFDNPRVAKKFEKKLAREQQRLARKQKGSSNYEKQKTKVARIHERVANKREYETHSLTRQLVNENGVIVSREISPKTLMQHSGSKLPKKVKRIINRAINDANFAEINRQLAYKSERAGRDFVLISSDVPISQVCSSCRCGHIAASEKFNETWQCSECGITHNRRLNAAKNALEAGLIILTKREETTDIECKDTKPFGLKEKYASFEKKHSASNNEGETH